MFHRYTIGLIIILITFASRNCSGEVICFNDLVATIRNCKYVSITLSDTMHTYLQLRSSRINILPSISFEISGTASHSKDWHSLNAKPFAGIAGRLTNDMFYSIGAYGTSRFYDLPAYGFEIGQTLFKANPDESYKYSSTIASIEYSGQMLSVEVECRNRIISILQLVSSIWLSKKRLMLSETESSDADSLLYYATKRVEAGFGNKNDILNATEVSLAAKKAIIVHKASIARDSAILETTVPEIASAMLCINDTTIWNIAKEIGISMISGVEPDSIALEAMKFKKRAFQVIVEEFYKFNHIPELSYSLGVQMHNSSEIEFESAPISNKLAATAKVSIAISSLNMHKKMNKRIIEENILHMDRALDDAIRYRKSKLSSLSSEIDRVRFTLTLQKETRTIAEQIYQNYVQMYRLGTVDVKVLFNAREEYFNSVEQLFILQSLSSLWAILKG